VAAVGGGTGLSSLLRGLKVYTDQISAVVAVTDDGGSSGRLRQELGILPPGDVRNCLVALADSEPLMTRLFDYRFPGPAGELGGHSFGNLLIAALTSLEGDFVKALQDSSRILAVRGQVLPATIERSVLCAKLRDGSEVRGETAIAEAGNIDYVYLDPPAPRPLPAAVEALRQAEAIVIGPGSVYTSLIPNLLVPGVREALVESSAPRIYVCNVMTQPGETDGYTAVEHVQALLRHTEDKLIDFVLVNTRKPSADVLARYRRQGAEFVEPAERDLSRLGVIPIEMDLVAEGSWVRHDPLKLARALMGILDQDLSP
jgi:uncharacterized cofD-like protein